MRSHSGCEQSALAGNHPSVLHAATTATLHAEDHMIFHLSVCLQAQKAADEARARAQMEAALGGGGGGDGASWGLLGPDAEWEEGAGPGGGEGLDWRLYMEKQTLTDKQVKLVDKIRWVEHGRAGWRVAALPC